LLGGRERVDFRECCRREVEGGPRSRRQWARPRSLDEMADSIMRKLQAIAPRPLLPRPAGTPDEA
jgi:hypothetical protein